MIEIEKDLLQIRPTRVLFGTSFHTSECIVSGTSGINRIIGIIPGLAGESLETMFSVFSKRYAGTAQIWGSLHSGIKCNANNAELLAGTEFTEGEIINGNAQATHGGLVKKEGVTVDDWVRDVENMILHTEGTQIDLITHSLGGPIAMTALGNLIGKQRINLRNQRICIFCVSGPFYSLTDLPDRTTLLGFPTTDGSDFSYYSDKRGDHTERINAFDDRIPMSSKHALINEMKHYLDKSGSMYTNRDESLFKTQLASFFQHMEENIFLVGEAKIRVVALYPSLDRWVGRKAASNIDRWMSHPVSLHVDDPRYYFRSSVGVNVHNKPDSCVPFLINIYEKYQL